MSGRLAVVGLGPGDPRYLTPEAAEALSAADALYGYGPYLDRVPLRNGQSRHPSDNREEGARAAAALRHASQGAHVAVVSGGDPGVFAMAAAICEQIESGPEAWRALDVVFVPGITAMLAVAAKIGAPLGHDFCALSLSDNLKPWELIERRLDAAAGAGFAIALYNPISRARPWQLGQALERLRRQLPGATPVVFGRAVGRPDERISVTTLAEADAAPADMATLVIIGTRETRVVARPGRSPLVYTPRAAAEVQRMIEPRKRGIDALDRRPGRRRRPAHQDDLDTERTGRGDLAIGRWTAAVLGDDDVDTVRLQQRAIVGFAERSARCDVGHRRQRQRRIDRVDAADQIAMLRRAGKRREFVAAERDKDASAFRADSVYCGACVIHFDPAIARDCGPGRPAQRHKAHAGLARGGRGVCRNDGRVRMRSVDQNVDAFRSEIIGQTRSAAEAADPDGYGMRNRRSGAAGERQRHLEIAAPGQAFAQHAGFGSAAENEDAWHAVS